MSNRVAFLAGAAAATASLVIAFVRIARVDHETDCAAEDEADPMARASAIAATSENQDVVRELVTAQRDKLIQNGWSGEAAEQMAAILYVNMLGGHH